MFYEVLNQRPTGKVSLYYNYLAQILFGQTL